MLYVTAVQERIFTLFWNILVLKLIPRFQSNSFWYNLVSLKNSTYRTSGTRKRNVSFNTRSQSWLYCSDLSGGASNPMRTSCSFTFYRTHKTYYIMYIHDPRGTTETGLRSIIIYASIYAGEGRGGTVCGSVKTCAPCSKAKRGCWMEPEGGDGQTDNNQKRQQRRRRVVRKLFTVAYRQPMQYYVYNINCARPLLKFYVLVENTKCCILL